MKLQDRRGTESPGPEHVFWSLRDVIRQTGLSRATIYRYVARGVFPQRLQIGPGRVAWRARDVIRWMESRPEVT